MDSYNNAYSILESRRLAARAKHLEKQQQLTRDIPGLLDLNDKITNTGAEYTLAKLAKQTQLAAEKRAEMDSLSRQRRLLLENHGYSEKDLLPVYSCDLCRDTGFVNGKVCRCMKDEITLQRQKNLTRLSPAPNGTFESFNLDFYPKKAMEQTDGTFIIPFNHMKGVFEFCKNYAEGFDLHNKSLLMTGTAGLGKTHLACGIAKVCMEKGFVVMYSSAQSLFAKIEQNRYNDEDIIGDILACDLFILDDLGAENMTTYSQSVLYNIVNTRMIEGKPCIYTTNIVSRDMLKRRYGEKITSRLLGNCTHVPFKGEDIRILKNRAPV